MLPKILFFLGGFLCIPIIPLLIWQGKQVRKVVPTLPEAEGTSGQIIGNESVINILTIGESTFAGVGVQTHEEGVTGQLAKFLHAKTQQTINWQVIAKSGYNAKKVLEDLVPQIPETPFDIVVIGLGGNDTFELNFPIRWQRDLINTIKEIQLKLPQARILISPLPPVGQFPAFPFPMNKFLGGLKELHSLAVNPIPKMFNNVYYDSSRFKSIDGAIMFSDGVHPSAFTYSVWGEKLADFIVEKKLCK